MPSTLQWLRGRSDDALARLLRARPDLTVPAPGDLAVLARRLDSPPSVWRVMESLDRFAVQIVQALTLLGADERDVTPAEVASFFGASADRGDLDRVLDRLADLGLVRGDGGLHLPRAAADALGPYPAGLGPAAGLDAAAVDRALAGISPAARAVLDRLVPGPPIGTLSGTRKAPAAVTELLGAGLLVQLDPTTVQLPREVGLAARGAEPVGPVESRPPPSAPTTPGIRTVDGTAAGQALAAVGRLNRLLTLTGSQPVAVLKSGGLGIRELRRLARELGTDEHLAALYLELLAAAGLISTSEPRSVRTVNSWTPTHAADEFLAAPPETAWSQIAEVWLDLRRDPSRVGEKDVSDRLLNALAPELSWIRGPADRRFVLGALATLPVGTGLVRDDLAGRLAWQAPLRGADRRAAVLAGTLTEATELGIVAFDALGTAGRAVLAGDVGAAAAAFAKALPPPVETVLVQADLTVVAPGRLVPALAARLEQAADVESAGSATVYRVTPDSLRRALDAGVSTADLHQLFAGHSATGVPQALTYLIDDVARRYGKLRAGTTSTYLHSDDPTLIAQAVAAAAAGGITLRRLAPTVAISSAEVEDLHQVLRDAGLAPVAEDAFGAVLDLRPRPKRTAASLVTHQRWREPPVPSDEQLATLVSRMRSVDEAEVVTTTQTPAVQLAILRDAAAHRTPVWIGYVNSEGSTTHRMIEPVAVSGGTVAAYDRLREQMRTFVLHRITGVTVATVDELAED